MTSKTPAFDSRELRTLVRRMVREELAALLHQARPEILDDRSHEGPEDPAEDELLLRDALVTLQEHLDHPERFIDWEDFEASLTTGHRADEVRETAAVYDKRGTESQPEHGSRAAVKRLAARGRIRPARGDLRDLGPPPNEPHDISISEALKEQRYG